MNKKTIIIVAIIALVGGFVGFAKAASPSVSPYLASQRWVVHGQAVYRFVDPDNNITCYIEGGVDGQNNQTTSEQMFCLK